MFREMEGGHRLELKDIIYENWVKLGGGGGVKPFSGGKCPLSPPPLKTCNELHIILLQLIINNYEYTYYENEYEWYWCSMQTVLIL